MTLSAPMGTGFSRRRIFLYVFWVLEARSLWDTMVRSQRAIAGLLVSRAGLPWGFLRIFAIFGQRVES